MIGPKTAVSQRSPSTPDEESAQKKFALMVAKQDRLLKGMLQFCNFILHICIYILVLKS